MTFILLVASALGALTWLLGWWGVLLGAAIVGFVFYEQGGGGWRASRAIGGLQDQPAESTRYRFGRRLPS